jgi:hypothetical protein
MEPPSTPEKGKKVEKVEKNGSPGRKKRMGKEGWATPKKKEDVGSLLRLF